MKITYYGTAAAEAWPGVFCRCDACERARAAGGRRTTGGRYNRTGAPGTGGAGRSSGRITQRVIFLLVSCFTI